MGNDESRSVTAGYGQCLARLESVAVTEMTRWVTAGVPLARRAAE
jgi:hypothetical protein